MLKKYRAEKFLKSFCPFLANPPQGKVVTLENFARWTCQPFHIWKNGVILHQGWVWTLREGKNLLQVSDWNPMNQIVLQSTAWGLKMHWQCAYWRAGSFKYSTQDIIYLNQSPGKIFTNSRLNIFWQSWAWFLILSTYFCSNFAFLAARAALLVSAVSSVIIGRTSHSKGQFNSRKFPGADIWPVLWYSPLLLDQITFFGGEGWPNLKWPHTNIGKTIWADQPADHIWDHFKGISQIWSQSGQSGQLYIAGAISPGMWGVFIGFYPGLCFTFFYLLGFWLPPLFYIPTSRTKGRGIGQFKKGRTK